MKSEEKMSGFEQCYGNLRESATVYRRNKQWTVPSVNDDRKKREKRETPVYSVSVVIEE